VLFSLSKFQTLDDSDGVKGNIPLARCCGQECPRSGAGGSVKMLPI
jgi:hypothetical protein